MTPTEPPSAKPLTRRRRALRWCVRTVLAILAFVALYFLAVLVLGSVSVNDDYVQAERGIEIRVWDHGVHTDIVVPTRTPAMNWDAFAPLEGDGSPFASRYVQIGWGDHDFYLYTPTWDDFSYATTLKAIFLPTRTVMHLKYRDWLPEPKDKCVKLILTEAEYRTLVDFIRDSFLLDAAGETMVIPAKGYTDTDVFYQAKGTYHLFYTCNNWANTALKRTGVKTAAWSPFGYAIFDHVKNR